MTSKSTNQVVLAGALIALFCACPAYSQNNETTVLQQRKDYKSTRTSKDNPEVASRMQWAEEQLAALGERTKKLDNGIMKVKILAEIGDALWQRRESQARQYLILAFQTIGDIKLDPKEDQRAALAHARGGAPNPLFKLRAYVLRIISRHDLKLAEQLRKSLEQDPKKDDAKDKDVLTEDELTNIRLEMAVELAKNQPDVSLRIIREVLQERMDEHLSYALLSMRRENPTLADQLFREALLRASTHEDSPNDIVTLAIYMLPTEQDQFFGNDPLREASRRSLIQQFLDYIYTESRQLTSGSFSRRGAEVDNELAARVYYTLRNLFPLFDRFQPQRSAVVREHARSLLGVMSPRDANVAEKPSRTSVDDLLRQAESTVGERRRTIRFMRASSAALDEGDIDRAVAIAARIDDLHERRIQTSLVLYQAASQRLREANLDAAYQYANSIEFLPQRVAILQRVAQMLWKNKEPDRAHAILTELWDWLLKADNSPSKADAMLAVTATMAKRDSERGFDFLNGSANALNNTDFSLKPFDPKRISVELHISPDLLDLESTFAVLARNDSARAQAVAASLKRPDISLLSQAIVAHQVFSERLP